MCEEITTLKMSLDMFNSLVMKSLPVIEDNVINIPIKKKKEEVIFYQFITIGKKYLHFSKDDEHINFIFRKKAINIQKHNILCSMLCFLTIIRTL